MRLEIFFSWRITQGTTLTETYLEKRYIEKNECPPKSKDLNQIENV